jgi:hypothetical protein
MRHICYTLTTHLHFHPHFTTLWLHCLLPHLYNTFATLWPNSPFPHLNYMFADKKCPIFVTLCLHICYTQLTTLPQMPPLNLHQGHLFHLLFFRGPLLPKDLIRRGSRSISPIIGEMARCLSGGRELNMMHVRYGIWSYHLICPHPHPTKWYDKLILLGNLAVIKWTDQPTPNNVNHLVPYVHWSLARD